MTIKEYIHQATQKLVERGIDQARLTAEMCMAKSLDCERVGLLLCDHLPLQVEQEKIFLQAIERCEQGEPVAYVLGEREFFGRVFRVTKDVLIPRPESEHIIEEALCALPDEELVFADFGTGSGCLAVTLLAERPLWKGIAIDISEKALAVAKENAKKYGVLERLQFVQASFTEPLLFDASLELLLSNPPYISKKDYLELDDNVRLFEPALALSPSCFESTGLEYLESIVYHAQKNLKGKGFLIMEHAFDQGEAVRALCKNPPWQKVRTYKDLAGLDRGVFACRA